jgi:hypothetical protein
MPYRLRYHIWIMHSENPVLRHLQYHTMITSENDIECFTRSSWTTRNLSTLEFASSTGLRVQLPPRGPSLSVLCLSKWCVLI